MVFFTIIIKLWVSQVEVNLLTGQTTILQSDIIYDCGQSLNPAVDLGQVSPTIKLYYFISFYGCVYPLALTFNMFELGGPNYV